MNIIQAMPNNPLRPILVDLDSPGSHITYNTLAKQASLYEGDLAAGSPRMGVPVSSGDLVTLFEKGWIAKYDSGDSEHRYRLTESGRMAIVPKTA
jgi:hypothetical protein